MPKDFGSWHVASIDFHKQITQNINHLIWKESALVIALYSSTAPIQSYENFLLLHYRADSRLRLVNDRRRYFVTTSLIGWVQAYNQTCIIIVCFISMHRTQYTFISPRTKFIPKTYGIFDNEE